MRRFLRFLYIFFLPAVAFFTVLAFGFMVGVLLFSLTGVTAIAEGTLVSAVVFLLVVILISWIDKAWQQSKED